MQKKIIKDQVAYFERVDDFEKLSMIVISLRRSVKKGIISNIRVDEDMECDCYLGLRFTADRLETDEECKARQEKNAKAKERARKAALTSAQRKEENEKKEYERLKKKFGGKRK